MGLNVVSAKFPLMSVALRAQLMNDGVLRLIRYMFKNEVILSSGQERVSSDGLAGVYAKALCFSLAFH